MKDINYRLPQSIRPKHYAITLRPEESEPILHGQVTIQLEVVSETKEITLNGLNVSVQKAVYTPSGTPSSSSLESKDVVINKELESIKIGFNNEVIAKGGGVLTLDYTGELTDNMKGLYRTKGKDNRYNYITHFEPANARRCFPGFDEPSFKATFAITLIVPKDRVAISNMPLKEETAYPADPKYKVCTYETTPPMSTYLVAVVIGDFEYLEKKSESGKLIRVFTPPGKKEQGKYSLNLAARLIDHFAQYFGVPYPLPKCDLVGIPEFPIGGMENYGLITFVDTYLLIDEKETSSYVKQVTTLIVTHEVSHLWFGDLVTPVWWTDLWLKEGFARFMEFSTVNRFYPEFDVLTQFVSRIFSGALATDALKNSHPVEVVVNKTSEIDEIFDAISYSKGSSIIRMMYNYIGEEAFKKGMQSYLKKFEYSNAETADLWKALESSSGKPVGKFMDTFTKQMGYPIVTVEQIKNTNGGKQLVLKQRKFWLDTGAVSKEETDKYKWIVPLTYCKGSEPNKVQTLELFDGFKSDAMELFIPNVQENEWVKLNAFTTGFYRVAYSPEVLAQFAIAIKNKGMSTEDRLGVLNDLLACCKVGIRSTVDLLKLLEAFKEEDNYSVISCTREITDALTDVFLRRPEILSKFNTYCCGIYQRSLEKVGWEEKSGDGHTTTLLRSLAINKLIDHGCEKAIKQASTLFEKQLKGELQLSANMRAAVYKAVVKSSTDQKATMKTMLDLYRSSDSSEEKSRILESLGYVKDPNLLREVLNFGISSEVKTSDINYVFASMHNSVVSQEEAWKFFKEKIALFQERYPGGMLVCSLVRLATSHFIGSDIAKEIETFLTANQIRGTERTVAQICENIKVNTKWAQEMEKDLPEMIKFFGGN